MSPKRQLPFGYCMENAVVVEHPAEAAFVRSIFKYYLEGQSLLQIANGLNTAKVRYSTKTESWDKNSVRRVLENSRYSGDAQWPALISSDTFETAMCLRTCKARTPAPELGTVRKRIQCAVCGTKRHHIIFRRKRGFWFCPTCNDYSRELDAPVLLDTIQQKLTWLTEHADWLCTTQTEQQNDSLTVPRLNREISRMLEQSLLDEDAILALLAARLKAQYAACSVGDYDPMTLQLREAVRQQLPSQGFCEQLFLSAVDAVLIDARSNLQLRLMNGQIL
ncbi:MAG: recombinase family protein [Oscillospiraceae bacterium]